MSDDVPFNEVPAEQTTSMVSVQTDATHRTASPMVPPKVKLDHLGKPLKEGKQRYRYARTCTIVYDGAGSAESAAKEKTWRLLQDARRALDLSGAGLDALFRILQRQAPARNHSLMEAPAFRQAFHQYFKSHGVRDMILVRRLFADFKEPVIEHEEPIIDFRQFVRVLAGMSHEHVEHRLEVLFDVWDADESGTLSFPELASHVTHDLPMHRVAGAMEEFTVVWGQIKRFAANARREAGEDVDDDDPFAAGGGLGKKKVDANAAEIEKKHLVAACVRLPAVRYFFEDLLTHRPPKADELARGNLVRNFQARLRELDAEVIQEVKVGEMGASERLERPGTTAGGGRMTPKEAREQEIQRKLKERTDAMLKAVEESRTGSLGITQSSSAKTVAMARHEARPMTVNPMAGGRRRTRPTRSLHAFIRPNSVTELAPLAPIRGTNAKAQIAKSASLS